MNKRSSLNQIILWIPGIAYMALIFYLSSRSSFGMLSYIPISDKLVHFVLYAGLASSLFIGAYKAPLTQYFSPYWLVFLIAILYGISDEFHQGFVPNRSVDIRDWLADVSGAAFGLIIIAFYFKLRRQTDDRRKNQ